MSHTAQSRSSSLASSAGNSDALKHQNLMQRNNAHIAACRLPPELLVEVFLLVQKAWPLQGEVKGPECTLRYSHGWMTVTHVCATWRRVAISTPRLWQDVEALELHPDYAREILPRSAGLNLRIGFRQRFRREGDVSKHWALSREIWFDATVFRRLETLAITCYDEDERLTELLAQEAPRIKYLFADDACSNFLPLNTFGTALPRFRQLSVRMTYLLPGSSLLAPTLTHLKMEVTGMMPDGCTITTAQLLSALSGLPALEYLYTRLYPLEHGGDAPLQKVFLPAMKYLFINLNSDDWNLAPGYATLFQHMFVAPTAAIAARAAFRVFWDPPLFRQIFISIFTGDPRNIPPLELDVSSSSQWDIYQWDPVTQSRAGSKRINLELARFTHWDAVFGLYALLQSICPQSLVVGTYIWESLPACKYEDLALHDDEARLQHDGTSSLWGVLSKAHDARSLTVCYCDSGRLWLALTAGPQLFPRLETIVLRDFHLSWIDEPENGRVFEDAQTVHRTHECAADKKILSRLIPGLIGAVQAMREAGVFVREVRVEGWLESWSGWDSVRAVLGSLRDVLVLP